MSTKHPQSARAVRLLKFSRVAHLYVGSSLPRQSTSSPSLARCKRSTCTRHRATSQLRAIQVGNETGPDSQAPNSGAAIPAPTAGGRQEPWSYRRLGPRPTGRRTGSEEVSVGLCSISGCRRGSQTASSTDLLSRFLPRAFHFDTDGPLHVLPGHSKTASPIPVLLAGIILPIALLLV